MLWEGRERGCSSNSSAAIPSPFLHSPLFLVLSLRLRVPGSVCVFSIRKTTLTSANGRARFGAPLGHKQEKREGRGGKRTGTWKRAYSSNSPRYRTHQLSAQKRSICSLNFCFGSSLPLSTTIPQKHVWRWWFWWGCGQPVCRGWLHAQVGLSFHPTFPPAVCAVHVFEPTAQPALRLCPAVKPMMPDMAVVGAQEVPRCVREGEGAYGMECQPACGLNVDDGSTFSPVA